MIGARTLEAARRRELELAADRGACRAAILRSGRGIARVDDPAYLERRQLEHAERAGILADRLEALRALLSDRTPETTNDPPDPAGAAEAQRGAARRADP